MNDLSLRPTETLPSLIDRAASALASAHDSAEVLEARDMARIAYDAAKSAGRMARAKQAHDTVISAVYRAQADALLIEARAKARLADEYDAAQERGEVARLGDNLPSVDKSNSKSTAADLGLRRDEIHEARQIRDAEQADPGLTERALAEMVERGEEPTKARLRREVVERRNPPRVMDQKALWVWGRLKDFERDGVLTADPEHLLNEMTEPMREDVRRLLPMVRGFLEDMEIRA